MQASHLHKVSDTKNKLKSHFWLIPGFPLDPVSPWNSSKIVNNVSKRQNSLT